MMKKLSIVILNWNGHDYLKKFLPLILKYSNESWIQVIVADNASTDDSVFFLKKQFPDVILIEMDKNYGFAGGYNKALFQLESEYFLLLNSDVEVTPNWTNPLVEYMDQNKDVAACMPKLKAYHNKNLFEYAGSGGGFIDVLGYPFCRGRIFETVEPDYGQYNSIRDIFWASGAAMLIRSEIYKNLGGLDEDFFAHMEEIDLCWRIKNQGYRIVCIPQSEIYHIGGGALPPESPHKTYLNYRNNLYMLTKNLTANLIFPVLIAKLILDGIAAARFLIQFKLAFPIAILKAHVHFYLRLFHTLSKRKFIPKQKKLGVHKEIYKGSIVWEYFVKGKKEFNKLVIS